MRRKFNCPVVFLSRILPAITLSILSQDFHFSNYTLVPLYVNPSQSGFFNGDVRFNILYRSQWGSISKPFSTFMFSGDLGMWRDRSVYPGIGLVAFLDRAGTSRMGILKIQFSPSAIIKISENMLISAGIGGSASQYSVNTTSGDLRWNIENSVEIKETAGNISSWTFDGSAGISFLYSSGASTLSSNDAFVINAGIAMHHLLSSPVKFLSRDYLPGRFTAHASSFIGIKNTNFGIIPSVIFMVQRPTHEISASIFMRITVKEQSRFTGLIKESAINIGVHWRVGDAIAPVILFEYAYYAFGLSYDLNISRLRAATSLRGGPEFFFRFIHPNPFEGKIGGGKTVRFL